MFSLTSCVLLSVPSPRERLSRLRVLWTDLTPERPSALLLVISVGLPVPPVAGTPTRWSQVPFGSPKFSSFLSTHTTLLCRPRQTLGMLTKTHSLCRLPIVRDRRHLLKNGSHHSSWITGLYQASGSAVFPVVYVFHCVRFNEVVQLLLPVFCVPVSRLIGVADIPSLMPRFSLFDGIPQTCLSYLLPHRNTRYDWLVRP